MDNIQMIEPVARAASPDAMADGAIVSALNDRLSFIPMMRINKSRKDTKQQQRQQRSNMKINTNLFNNRDRSMNEPVSNYSDKQVNK